MIHMLLFDLFATVEWAGPIAATSTPNNSNQKCVSTYRLSLSIEGEKIAGNRKFTELSKLWKTANAEFCRRILGTLKLFAISKVEAALKMCFKVTIVSQYLAMSDMRYAMRWATGQRWPTGGPVGEFLFFQLWRTEPGTGNREQEENPVHKCWVPRSEHMCDYI